MIDLEYLKDAHRYGPWDFDAWLKAVVQSGLYTPVPGKPGEYDFHPENWGDAKKILETAADRWLECMITGAKAGAERDASNVICLEHKKKLFKGEHVNDGLTRCNHRRYVKKAQPAQVQMTRPDGRAS